MMILRQVKLPGKRKASELEEAEARISKKSRAVGQHPPSRAEKIHLKKDDLIQINLDEDEGNR